MQAHRGKPPTVTLGSRLLLPDRRILQESVILGTFWLQIVPMVSSANRISLPNSLSALAEILDLVSTFGIRDSCKAHA